MQRSAASSPATKPDSANSPSSKRRRTGEHSFVSEPNSDMEAIKTALAAEELKRMQALERQATEAGDTKWILDMKSASSHGHDDDLNVVNAGYGTIDGPTLFVRIETNEHDKRFVQPPRSSGRKIFGNFGKAMEVRLKKNWSSRFSAHIVPGINTDSGIRSF